MQSKTPEHSPPGHLPPERKVQVSSAPGEVHREEVGEGRGHSTTEGLWELRSACRMRAGPSRSCGPVADGYIPHGVQNRPQGSNGPGQWAGAGPDLTKDQPGATALGPGASLGGWNRGLRAWPQRNLCLSGPSPSLPHSQGSDPTLTPLSPSTSSSPAEGSWTPNSWITSRH